MAIDLAALSPAQKLGLETELRATAGLCRLAQANGKIGVRHATPEEDLRERWDIRLELDGYVVLVDITISRARLAEKQDSHCCRCGNVLPVLVRPERSDQELAFDVLKAVVYALPDRAKKSLLRSLAA